MQIHDVQQGSKEWLELRQNHFTASEAPAMMGKSKYQTRDQLLKEKFTKESEPVPPYLQKIYDKGHATEAMARPIIESIIGEELYPVTGTNEVDGLPLLASFDGLTMGQETAFEHKLWNDDLAESVEMGTIEEHYLIQMEQQLMVSNAEKVKFVVSDGTPEKMVSRDYVSDPTRRAKIIAGWLQFQKDLENYEPSQVEEKPQAKSLMELPGLNVQVSGEVKHNNLALYEQSATNFIENINTDLQTDQDFVDADKAAKFCREAVKKLDLVKDQAMAQMQDVDTVFKSIDKISEDFRNKALKLEKLVKSEKDSRKSEAVAAGKKELDEYIAEKNKAFNRPYLAFDADFRTAIKGLKTLDSVRSTINDTVASAKIGIDEAAEIVAGNVKIMADLASDHKFLFADLDQIIFKAPDDLTLLVKARIADHEAAEKAKAEEKEREAKAAGEAMQQAAEQRQEAVSNQQAPTTPTQGTETTEINLQAEIAQGFIDNGLTMGMANKVANLIISGNIPYVSVNLEG